VIRATSHCRVDLAGGTLDIWPIGLLHAGAATVNFAVTLPATVRLRAAERFYRVVQGGSERRAESLEELVADPDTALVGLVARELELPPVEIELASASPRGAGLGASSALTVALLAAGEMHRDGAATISPERRAAVARDLEARLMGLPTGLQDHLPGQLGGALAIEHRAGGERVRRLRVDLEALGERLLVAFTGESHFSAGNNWSVLRRRFERDPDTIARFDAIRDVGLALPGALEAADWPAVGRLVAAEWSARSGLAPEVSTPRIEELLAAARERGAWGGKACGAGGGGSIAAVVPPERRGEVESAWREAGAQILDARPTAAPLELVREDP